jgi:hypothetical protein
MGCASSYRPIITDKFTYPKITTSAGLEVAHQYNVLKEAGNRKYAKKELRRNIRVVAVAITNKTDSVIIVKDDLDFYASNRKIFLLTPEETKHSIRQVSGLYLFWGLFVVTLTKCDDNSNDCSRIPLPVGLLIGLINMGVASNANNGLLEDLVRHDLMRKKIQPGETVEGLIGISTDTNEPLMVRFK